jgi:hypothetical protein
VAKTVGAAISFARAGGEPVGFSRARRAGISLCN